MSKDTKLESNREQKTWNPHAGLTQDSHPTPISQSLEHIPMGHRVSTAGKETFKIFLIRWLLEWILVS